MAKYCPECGEPIKQGSNFCKKCGHKFFEKMQNTQQNANSINSVSAMPKKHCGFGIASLVLGIVSMSLIWITIFPGGAGFILYLLVEIPMSIIATIMGAVAFWGKWKDKFGLAGFILGLLVIVLGLVFSVILWMII